MLVSPLAGHLCPKALLLPQRALMEEKKEGYQQLVEDAGSHLCLHDPLKAGPATGHWGTAATSFQFSSDSADHSAPALVFITFALLSVRC